MTAARHVGRAAAQVCARAALLTVQPQQSLRAVPVAALLSLTSLKASSSQAGVTYQAGVTAGSPWWHQQQQRSFASSAVLQGQPDGSSSGGISGSIDGGRAPLQAAATSSGTSSSASAAAGSSTAGGGPAHPQQVQQGRAAHSGALPAEEQPSQRQQAQAAKLPARGTFKVEAAYVGAWTD
jgi:hypothetical protein